MAQKVETPTHALLFVYDVGQDYTEVTYGSQQEMELEFEKTLEDDLGLQMLMLCKIEKSAEFGED